MPLPTWFHRLLDGYLTSDPHQRTRIAMTSLAAGVMLLCMALFNALAWAGLAQQGPMLWWTLSSLVGIVGVALFIRSGLALRLKLRDPSLTQFQLRYALVCCAWLYVIAGEARPLTPAMLALIMSFGVFGMSSRQTAYTAAFGLPLFVGAWWLAEALAPPSHSPALELGTGVLIAVVLVGMTALSVRLQRLRARLSQQKEDLAHALEQIHHLAAHDELTGLANRRRMGELLEHEQRRMRRLQQPLYLALLDIDHFKAVNDTHGHAHGDAVLKTFADTVVATVRDSDVLARWGGEEFLLLLCDTDLPGAHEVVERVRRAVQAMPAQAPGAQPVTVSIGLASHWPGQTLDETMEHADRALYDAKARGRNAVVVARG